MQRESLKILITGVNRGLGFYLAENMLKQGHQVFAMVRTLSRELEKLHDSADNRLSILKIDITDEKQLDKAFDSIQAKTDSLDMLINNAGVHLENHRPDFAAIDFSVYLPSFEVNAVTPLKIIRRFLPLIRNGNRKMIVNVSSEAGSITNAQRKNEYSYCMSKAALNMASKILQNRLKSEGIKVLAVHPGWFSSDMGGADAPVTPKQAAEQVAGTLLKDWKLNGPIYISPNGKKMKW